MSESTSEHHLLDGLDFTPLDEGTVPLAAIVLIQIINPDGRTGWAFRSSESLNDIDRIGPVATYLDLVRDNAQSMYEDEDDD